MVRCPVEPGWTKLTIKNDERDKKMSPRATSREKHVQSTVAGMVGVFPHKDGVCSVFLNSLVSTLDAPLVTEILVLPRKY